MIIVAHDFIMHFSSQTTEEKKLNTKSKKVQKETIGGHSSRNNLSGSATATPARHLQRCLLLTVGFSSLNKVERYEGVCDEESHYGQNPINIQGSMGGSR